MDSQYNNWNKIKIAIEYENIIVGFKERDIFYMNMGKNIGFEQDGKGENFVRPVVIIKGFNKNMFFGIPLHISEYSDSNVGVQPDTFAMRFSSL